MSVRYVRSLKPWVERLSERQQYEMAMAAARDEGNRSMRSAGRPKWSLEDWNAMCAEFHRLMPCPSDVCCDLCNPEIAPEEVAR